MAAEAKPDKGIVPEKLPTKRFRFDCIVPGTNVVIEGTKLVNVICKHFHIMESFITRWFSAVFHRYDKTTVFLLRCISLGQRGEGQSAGEKEKETEMERGGTTNVPWNEVA